MAALCAAGAAAGLRIIWAAAFDVAAFDAHRPALLHGLRLAVCRAWQPRRRHSRSVQRIMAVCHGVSSCTHISCAHMCYDLRPALHMASSGNGSADHLRQQVILGSQQCISKCQSA